MVNVCGHALCEGCIELMFATGAAKCYQCPIPLKRYNYKPQVFQDSQVEKVTNVARDILNKFRRSQDKFPTLRAYNDHLEKLETVIYNLSNDLDIEETNTLLEELRTEASETSHEIVNIQRKHQKVKDTPYHHRSESLHTEGPTMPVLEEKYLRAVRTFSNREVAGGFTAQLAISRALGEAFNGLFTRPSKIESY